MRKFFLALAATLAFAPLAAHSDGPVLQESSFWAQEVNAGSLPHVQDRIPSEPLVVDLEAKGRSFGRQGGTLRTLISRTKDVRQMVVYGYARLVGYQPDYTLAPDILAAVDVEEGRKFTLHLRPGHRWSDGMPFTSDDFRYWWENVANDPDITPSGPPDFMIVDNRLGKVTFPDEHTVVFEWQIPNPNFLPLLAQASPPFIYRPAHYLSQFHKKFADPDALAEKIKAARVKSWAALHNKRDNMYKFDNPALPTLQPWINTSDKDSSRKLFVRNPYFHRIDSRGVQPAQQGNLECEQERSHGWERWCAHCWQKVQSDPPSALDDLFAVD